MIKMEGAPPSRHTERDTLMELIEVLGEEIYAPDGWRHTVSEKWEEFVLLNEEWDIYVKRHFRKGNNTFAAIQKLGVPGGPFASHRSTTTPQETVDFLKHMVAAFSSISEEVDN